MSQSINYTSTIEWHIRLFRKIQRFHVFLSEVCEFNRTNEFCFISRSFYTFTVRSVTFFLPRSFALHLRTMAKASNLVFCLNRIYFDNRWRPILRGLCVRSPSSQRSNKLHQSEWQNSNPYEYPFNSTIPLSHIRADNFAQKKYKKVQCFKTEMFAISLLNGSFIELNTFGTYHSVIDITLMQFISNVDMVFAQEERKKFPIYQCCWSIVQSGYPFRCKHYARGNKNWA